MIAKSIRKGTEEAGDRIVFLLENSKDFRQEEINSIVLPSRCPLTMNPQYNDYDKL